MMKTFSVSFAPLSAPRFFSGNNLRITMIVLGILATVVGTLALIAIAHPHALGPLNAFSALKESGGSILWMGGLLLALLAHFLPKRSEKQFQEMPIPPAPPPTPTDSPLLQTPLPEKSYDPLQFALSPSKGREPLCAREYKAVMMDYYRLNNVLAKEMLEELRKDPLSFEQVMGESGYVAGIMPKVAERIFDGWKFPVRYMTEAEITTWCFGERLDVAFFGGLARDRGMTFKCGLGVEVWERRFVESVRARNRLVPEIAEQIADDRLLGNSLLDFRALLTKDERMKLVNYFLKYDKKELGKLFFDA